MKKRFKFLLVLFIFSNSFSQANKKVGFELYGNFKKTHNGYIYMDYQNKVDSCRIINNHFAFNGFIENNSCIAYFRFKDEICTMKNSFYLENNIIRIDVDFEQKSIKGYDVIFFETKNIKGSTTSKIQEDYDLFLKKNPIVKGNNEKLYKKINYIFSKNPKNKFCGEILSTLSSDEKLEKAKLIKAYNMLDKKCQDEFSIKRIEDNLFPEKKLIIGQAVFDFQLPDENNKIIDTRSLEGKYYLIDFWTTTCSPCRKQLPELKRIYDVYKYKNFEILGVSLDGEKQKWINTINKENLNWLNVIENGGIFGLVAKKYGVFAIPSNFLINPLGKIVAKDIEPIDLEKYLEENLKQ